MAEMKVAIDGSAGALSVGNTSGTPLYVTGTSTAPVYTLPASPGNIYTTLIFDAPGVVAANNFLSVFNPVGSGKSLVFYQFVAIPFANAAQSSAVSMLVFRCTTATGGTQRAAADINKFATSQPNSIAEVRTGNPTTTNGNVPVIAVPPAITNAANGASGVIDLIPPSGAIFVCAPGEGLVCRTTAGTVAESWDLGFTWLEI